MWDWIAWSIAVLAVWTVVAAFVGVLLGRAVRRRDRQVPTTEAESFPTPRAPTAEPPMSTERGPRS